MRLIIEEIDGSVYIDVILKDKESESLNEGSLVESMAIIKSRRYYVGLRVGEKWIYKDHINFLEDKEVE